MAAGRQRNGSKAAVADADKRWDEDEVAVVDRRWGEDEVADVGRQWDEAVVAGVGRRWGEDLVAVAGRQMGKVADGVAGTVPWLPQATPSRFDDSAADLSAPRLSVTVARCGPLPNGNRLRGRVFWNAERSRIRTTQILPSGHPNGVRGA